ncbi:MAG: PTS sugar transporter subunit IIA [Candidatus Omnitrophota bacterium]
MAAKEIAGVSLEEELKDIIRERDEINKDRFDRVIEESVVLDIDGAMAMDEFFKLAARNICSSLKETPEYVVDLLVDREKQSSTVLRPGLAIPHIIVEGREKFIILIARSKGGISFPMQEEKVHTVFVIAGSEDERDFHLRALSAIAQIVQDPHFARKWRLAKNEEAIRDIILLGERKRHK